MRLVALLPFSPGMGEIVLILAVALLLFGADQLPGFARSMGRWLHRIRRSADEFQDQLLDAGRDLPPDSRQPLSSPDAAEPETPVAGDDAGGNAPAAPTAQEPPVP